MLSGAVLLSALLSQVFNSALLRYPCSMLLIRTLFLECDPVNRYANLF